MSFHQFASAVNAQFQRMTEHQTLFEIEDEDHGRQLWQVYLDAFPLGTNEIFRTNTEHDCSCCRHFVRNIGRVVAINASNEMESVWDVQNVPYPYDVVAHKLAVYVRTRRVHSAYLASEPSYGAQKSIEHGGGGDITWHHFWARVPDKHISQTGEKAGRLNAAAGVLMRGLTGLKTGALQQIRDLITNNLLYRGQEFERQVGAFAKMQQQYMEAGSPELFVWRFCADPAAGFRNTAIGTLAVDLSEGKSLEEAVASYESKVAPTNYKRPKALITPAMVTAAMKQIAELGLEHALERRLARAADVSINNVLWADTEVRKGMKDSLTDVLLAYAKGVQTARKETNVPVDEFVQRVLPQATSMELLVRSSHTPNFMTLTAPVHEDSGQLFKWGNDFAWSYDGNITDAIKERVRKAGGKIDAPLRFSLAWSNNDDLDLAVVTPNGDEIFYGHRRGQYGQLDVDMHVTGPFVPDPVENIFFSKVVDGVYEVQVHQFTARSLDNVGFTVEVECAGKVMHFTRKQALPGRQRVRIGRFVVRHGQIVEVGMVDSSLLQADTPVQKWGITTETFVPVSMVMLSPNHWDDNAVGNKHWFFILKGCRTEVPTRGIYNEFLHSRHDVHRKVFEVLGAKTQCPATADQLSGLGFSSTRDAAVTIRVTGEKLSETFNVTF